jgi:hypothetical protein
MDPDLLRFSRDAGSRSLEVRTKPDCSWTASAAETWIRISTSSGTGPGKVTVSVERNHREARASTITVGGVIVPVEQEGLGRARITLNGSVSNLTGSCPSVTFTVADRRVYADANTRFKNECAALIDGTRVKVEGNEVADGRVDATAVEAK